jgi:hypothetical protein
MLRIDMVLSRHALSFEGRHGWRTTLRERYLQAGFSKPATIAGVLLVRAAG